VTIGANVYWIGVIGSALLGLCGLPEVIFSIKNKKCNLTWGLLICWGVGELFLLIYIVPSMDIPLILNYLTNFVFVGIMVFYKFRSRL
jgi:uncharacterized protein with PQ loop repeat